MVIFVSLIPIPMERLSEITAIVTGGHTRLGYVLVGLVLVLFGVELIYWLGRYGRLSKYRNVRRQNPREVDGISVVVILTDDFEYLENTVPVIMGQEYADFELVVVDVSSSPEFADELQMLKARYPRLSSARLDPDPRFRISNKMIYNVGIKTAHYGNVILTTPDAAPVSSKWLDCMAKGFANGEILIAYCGLEKKRGLANGIMRCGRLMTSVRYLSAAAAGHPYRGILQNLGINKELYIEKRGFNRLNITVGEDDLFVQKLARYGDTSIIMNPHATMRQTIYGGLGGWWRQRRLLGTTRESYPGRARRATTAELWFRFILMLAIAACGVYMPLYTALGAAAVWIIRSFIVRHQTVRISRRLGEKGLGGWMMLYDIVEPFVYIILTVLRYIRPPKENWK